MCASTRNSSSSKEACLTSRVAKLNAPWGMDMTNCAPAPLVRSLNDRFDSCDAVPRPCKSVFTTLAGCMHVCARLRLTAPANIASLNVRLTAPAPAPPRDAFAALNDPFRPELLVGAFVSESTLESAPEFGRPESAPESARPVWLPTPRANSCRPFLRSRFTSCSQFGSDPAVWRVSSVTAVGHRR